ncbi:hypothetical protein CesoFtcFv8_014313 [Champsocephalus esox]|uniref:Uncharacterized protein n=1 Tax=Champsocephalus esox TaxID=159716 RepID=A0AAN8BSU2_9TELE|nr:hypothetical protein CesoFtcFv8_014313 [Champsocephalus esox]
MAKAPRGFIEFAVSTPPAEPHYHPTPPLPPSLQCEYPESDSTKRAVRHGETAALQPPFKRVAFQQKA